MITQLRALHFLLLQDLARAVVLQQQPGCAISCDAGSTCLSSRKRCNGRAECEDGADEADCEAYECPPRYAKCQDGRQCVRETDLCDG